MYETALFVHSWLRWIVLIVGVVIVVRSFASASRHSSFTGPDKALGIVFVSVFDTQIILGLLLYFVWSPLGQAARAAGGEMMKNPALRFWGIEHLFAMLLAMVVMHVGRVYAKRAPTDAAKHKRLAWTTLATLVIVLSRIPWPSMAEVGRPLFRM